MVTSNKVGSVQWIRLVIQYLMTKKLTGEKYGVSIVKEEENNSMLS